MTRLFPLDLPPCSKYSFEKKPAPGLAHCGLPCRLAIAVLCVLGAMHASAVAQITTKGNEEAVIELMRPAGPGQTAPPVTITLADALERARKNDSQFLSTVSDAASAREDKLQAKASLLPSVNFVDQYLGTQGNGKLASGRYVSNDGVHMYRTWGVVHQDLGPATFLRTGVKRAEAAEAIANAKAEIAKRGLSVTVTKNYYSLASSQRKYATAQQAVEQAKRFFENTQEAERLRQIAHSDTIKAEIQYEQQRQAFEEAMLVMEADHLNLAVLLFPTLNENFSVVDDLDSAPALPEFPEAKSMAERENPDLKVAAESLKQANQDVTAARTSFLPSITVDTNYGIEANAFALHSTVAADREAGKLPNLGYFVTAGVTVPVWNWGTLRSKLRQSQLKQEQAKVELTKAQRQLLGNLYAFYNEASVSRASVEKLRRTADLASESLRLINLRYRAGESTALEVVDAQNTLTQARNAYDDAQVRYRVALANLQTVTGSF